MRVFVVVGPTAVGKTAFGIKLALQLGGEIVSADSRQVYRGLDLGTGKVTPSETKGVPHHLIDVADPRETFTAHDFAKLGRAAIADIAARGRVPIIVGGTGMYIDALLGRITLAEVKPDENLRAELSRLNLDMLQDELKRLDPERYKTIDTKNPRRLMRAIEIASVLKDRPREFTEDRPLYEAEWIGLTLPTAVLKERIHDRLIARLNAGMLDETKRLHAEGLSYERMDQLGLEYRYMARHLQGQLSYDEMVAAIDTESYKYSRRQMTWFKKNKDIVWHDAMHLEVLLSAL